MKYHTFRIAIPEDMEEHAPATISIELDIDADLYQVLEAFETFLQGVTFQIPEGKHLDFVTE